MQYHVTKYIVDSVYRINLIATPLYFTLPIEPLYHRCYENVKKCLTLVFETAKIVYMVNRELTIIRTSL